MTPTSNPPPTPATGLPQKAAGMFAIVAGAMTLIGWQFDIALLKSILPQLLAMKTNAAICLVLAGTSLCLQGSTALLDRAVWRNVSRMLGALVALIAAATLYEYLSGKDIGIDQWFYREAPDAIRTLAPNRMSPALALSLLLIGSALLAYTSAHGSRTWQRALAVGAAVPAAVSLLGIIYGLPSLYGTGRFTQMALHAALAVLALSSGIVLAHPDRGILEIFRSRTIGGLFLRRLLPAAILLPPLLGGMILFGSRISLHEVEFGQVIAAILHMLVFSVLIVWMARSLHRIDTERQHNEVELRSREDQFQRIFDFLRVPVMIYAEDGEVITINRMWTDLSGYRAEDIPTMSAWTTQAYRGKSAEIDARIRQMFETDATVGPVELTVHTLGGEARLWKIISAPMGRHIDGRRLRMASAQDITEQRGIEKILHTMSMATEQSPTGVLITDAQGGIQYANPKFTELTGYALKEISGKNIGIFESRNSEGESFYLSLWRALRSGQSWRGEMRSRKKDGALYWVQLSVAPIVDANGTTTNFVAIQEDITERKAVEQSLVLRKQQLTDLYEALNAVREEERRRFSCELHDELGQMLTALRIDLNWIEAALPNPQPAMTARMAAMDDLLAQIVDAVRRISEDLRPGMLDSLGLAPAIESYVQKFSARTGIACDLHIADDDFALDEKISITVFRITQEALNNAAKHSGATRMSIHLDYRGDDVVLIVEDNGRGLPAAHGQKKGGFGILGMRERITMIGGRFSISNLPGQGVRIEASIPVNPQN